MKYSVNPLSFSSVFTVPCSAVDKNIFLATELQLKVLLCAMRNLSQGINSEEISKFLAVPLSQVEDAMLYWCQNNIFCSENTIEKAIEKPTAPAAPKRVKPTREDVMKRGFEDPKVSFLMQEAQRYFGRNLTSSESTTLLWLYDDMGMDISVIMMILQYAVSENNLHIKFVEKTALYWIEHGVQNVSDAEKQISDASRRKTAWYVLEKAFGLERRMPSTKEAELADLWVNDWQISEDILKYAYDECIDHKSKFLMSYIKVMIEKWHKSGYKTIEDVKNGNMKKPAKSKNSFAAYDIDAFEKMLDSKDD